jgi:hypothetical protein
MRDLDVVYFDETLFCGVKSLNVEPDEVLKITNL